MYIKQHPVNLNSVSTGTALAAHDQELTAVYAEHQSIATDFAGTTAPQLPVTNCRWLDTSTTPPKLKRYNGATWVEEYIDHAINADNATTAGTCTGNAATATKIKTARTIAGASFDGSANIDVSYNNLTNKPTIPTVPSIATEAQAIAGTDNATIITPLKMRNGLNASGDAPVYACRAWVNFNGTGTPTIRGSGNVSSITDNGLGDYTINFITAMPDANYHVSFMTYNKTSDSGINACVIKTTNDTAYTPTAGSFTMLSEYVNSGTNRTAVDSFILGVSVFR